MAFETVLRHLGKAIIYTYRGEASVINFLHSRTCIPLTSHQDQERVEKEKGNITDIKAAGGKETELFRRAAPAVIWYKASSAKVQFYETGHRQATTPAARRQQAFLICLQGLASINFLGLGFL